MKLNPPEDINRKINSLRVEEKVSHFNHIFSTIARDQGTRIEGDDLQHVTFSLIDYMQHYQHWTLNDLLVACEYGKLGEWGSKEGTRTKVCFANVQIWVKKYHARLQAVHVEREQREAQERRKMMDNVILDGSCEWGEAVCWRNKMLMQKALTRTDLQRISIEHTVEMMKQGREMELIPIERRQYLTPENSAKIKTATFKRSREIKTLNELMG